jgi:hypothetical protein
MKVNKNYYKILRESAIAFGCLGFGIVAGSISSGSVMTNLVASMFAVFCLVYMLGFFALDVAKVFSKPEKPGGVV